MIVYLALAIAFSVPLLFLGFVRIRDLYGTGKFGLIIVALLGGLVAYFLAANINPWLLREGWATRTQVTTITAPIAEEFLKALILIYLVSRADFNYLVDGAIYGFAAGMGFAVIENYEYVMGHQNIAMNVAVARVFSTNLIHATGSGMIGTALAYQRGRGNSSLFGWLVAFLGYAFGMGFHMIFNTLVSSGAILLVAIIFGTAGLGLILLVIRGGMNTQKQWLGEKLNEIERITRSEVKALTRIEEIKKELFVPIEKQFGSAKVELVKKMISKQAELGIKRKLLETASSEGKRKEMELVIGDIKKDIDSLRNQIGPYCMMMVRQVYLEQDVKVFDLITARIAESSTGQKGGGLWDRASSRIPPKSKGDENSS